MTLKVASVVRCDELGNASVCTSNLNLALHNITFRLANNTLPPPPPLPPLLPELYGYF